MKIGAIVQARQTSRRLPNKVLMKLQSKTIVDIIYQRLNKSDNLDDVIFAIPDNESNLLLKGELSRIGIKFFCGSEDDVLKRYFEAAKLYEIDHVIRITGDCPLVDPKILDDMIEKYGKGKYDYFSNINPPSFPDGYDIEIFSIELLEKANLEAIERSEREHVTPYIKLISKRFGNYFYEKDYSNLRLTLDNPEDFELFSEISKEDIDITEVSFEEIIDIINSKPALIDLNASFERNEAMKK